MLRSFNISSLPDALALPVMFRCSEDRLLPLISIYKVPCNADSINASEVSVVFSHKGIYSWTGKNVSKSLREMSAQSIQDVAESIAKNSGKGPVNLKSFVQGDGAQDFWKLLQITSEPLDILSQSVRFNDPILRYLKEPVAPLELSSTTSNCIQIAVIGGGATGVFCARQILAPLYRQYFNLSVTLFEKSDCIGGMTSKTGEFEAGCPFFTARSAEFKEFTRKSFESGFVQPVDTNIGIGEAENNTFRTFRFASPSFESPEDQNYIYKHAINPIFNSQESTVPYFFPEPFLSPSDSSNKIRQDTDSRTGTDKPTSKPTVRQADFLFHEAHSLSQSMSAGNVYTGRLWRGHPSMSDWFQSLLKDPRIKIQLCTEVTNIERLQKRGGGNAVYGIISGNQTETFLGNFDYLAICTEVEISVRLTKKISRMMHLALTHSYQNDASGFNEYHQEMVVEFQPPLETTLDMIWLNPTQNQYSNETGLAFALKDSSRRRLFTTGVDRIRGHNDRITSMMKGYSNSTQKSHPVKGGSSSVKPDDSLRDVWVLYSSRGWNCLGAIGFNFVRHANEFKFMLQKSISDQKLAVNRFAIFVKQSETQSSRWQILIRDNSDRILELNGRVSKESESYNERLKLLLHKKEATLCLKQNVQDQLEATQSKILIAERAQLQCKHSLQQIEKDLKQISSEIAMFSIHIKACQDSAARCRLDVLAQEDKCSAATQLFDREAVLASGNDVYLSASPVEPLSVESSVNDQDPKSGSNKTSAAFFLTRLDSNISLEDPNFHDYEIAAEDVDYLVDKSAKEARERMETDHIRREKEMLLHQELSRCLALSQAAEQNLATQTSMLADLRAVELSKMAEQDEIRAKLQDYTSELTSLGLSVVDLTLQLDAVSQRLEFLGADDVALRVEILQHKQESARCISNLQMEADVLCAQLIEAKQKHDVWMSRLDNSKQSLVLFHDFFDETCKIVSHYTSEHKIHSEASSSQLCKDAIQVCEQSSFANLRNCDGDTVVHSFRQRYIGLSSTQIRHSKSRLLRYLSEFGAQTSVQSAERTSESALFLASEPMFVQHLYARIQDLKQKYSDFVLGKLIGDEAESFPSEDSETQLHEAKSTFIQLSGDKVQIDRNSDDFSPLSVLRLAAKLCKTCNLNSKDVILELLASDFDGMFAAMRKYFHQYISIINIESDDVYLDPSLHSSDEHSQDQRDSEDFDEELTSLHEHDSEQGSDCSSIDRNDDIDEIKTSAGFFRDSDDDSEFLDELSIDRRKRQKKLVKVLASASSELKKEALKRQERRDNSEIQSSASMCFDGSSLLDFHSRVCVCGNWLVDSSIEGAFLSGSGGAHRLMQSIEDDPVMLARLGEDAEINSLYAEQVEFRAFMQKKAEKGMIVRRIAQRSSSNFSSIQSLRNIFDNWRQVAIKGKSLSNVSMRIKNSFFNSCLVNTFNNWAKATDEQWALEFSAILQWTRTLKSRAFVHWRVVLKRVSTGSFQKTLACLFGPNYHDSDESDRDSGCGSVESQSLATVEPAVSNLSLHAVPLHTDLSNLYDWCRRPLPPYLWTSEDERCLKLPDISGSSDADLAKLARDFLKDKPTKQSEYLFRLGWLLYWYRDNNEFTPKTLAAKMVLWEERNLGLSPDVSGQVLYFYKMCTLFPLCRRLPWRKDHIMRHSRSIFRGLMEFQMQDPITCVEIWGEADQYQLVRTRLVLKKP